jgi:hypothetical protein
MKETRTRMQIRQSGVDEGPLLCGNILKKVSRMVQKGLYATRVTLNSPHQNQAVQATCTCT